MTEHEFLTQLTDGMNLHVQLGSELKKLGRSVPSFIPFVKRLVRKRTITLGLENQTNEHQNTTTRTSS